MRAKNISVTDLDVLMHKAVMASKHKAVMASNVYEIWSFDVDKKNGKFVKSNEFLWVDEIELDFDKMSESEIKNKIDAAVDADLPEAAGPITCDFDHYVFDRSNPNIISVSDDDGYPFMELRLKKDNWKSSDDNSEPVVSGNTSGDTGRQNILNCCYDTKTANTIFNGLYDDMTSVIIDGLSDTITTIVNDLVDRVYTKYENQYAHKKEQKIALWKQMLNILPTIDINVLSDILGYLENDDYWFPDGIEDDYDSNSNDEGGDQ